MRDALCDWVEQMVAKNEEFYIPLKKLWYGYRLLFPKREISLEEFERTLRKDDRFLFNKRVTSQKSEQESAEQTELMESLGFYAGAYISLKNRQPTQQDIARNVEKTFERLFSALSRMWEARNPQDKTTEESLIRVIEKVRALYTSYQENRVKQEEAEQT